MKKGNKTIGFFIMLAGMVIITFMPVITEASVQTNSRHYKDVETTQKSVSVADTPTGTLTYFYNGQTLMDAEDDNGNMSSYLGKAVRSIINESSKTVIQTNFLPYNGKSIVSETDETGLNVVDSYDYSPYGKPIYTGSSAQSNSTLSIFSNPLMYNGYYYDAESGLYYLNARYYSPELMMFISMDTYDLSNRYGYANGNPIWYSDPTGHFSLANLLINLVVTVAMIALLAVPAAGEVTDAGLATVQAGIDAETADTAATAAEEGADAAETTATNSKNALQEFTNQINTKIENDQAITDQEVTQGQNLFKTSTTDKTNATGARNAANNLRAQSNAVQENIAKAEKVASRDQWEQIRDQGRSTWQSGTNAVTKDGVSKNVLCTFSRGTQSLGGKIIRGGLIVAGAGVEQAGNATNNQVLTFVGTGLSAVGALGGMYATGWKSLNFAGNVGAATGGGVTDYFFDASGEEDHGGGNYASNNSPANSTASNYINNLY